ncbi:4'-phosphopantetheinyl transferase superfamily protein [uncultured Paraglaciecola sp.]|uniref:4'-phosphopantetheinyl transferase family protein n=1 Tax=uncultured Paraglaciecola sp. TaxID=1765024 RepID=UPI00262BF6F2|nr:4'-phosphopantetheinyl transferase superfamily protein [uncultured Paraglaciecola sp.]
MQLTKNKIHVYFCDMQQLSMTDKSLLELLNESDQARFQAFKNKSRQRQFAIARWLVKQALNEQFNIDIAHDYYLHEFRLWQIKATGSNFPVSISHSGDMVAVALASSPCAIGIDIEKHKKRNFQALLQVFSTEQEQAFISNGGDTSRLFYRLWTAKEAFFKVTQFANDLVYKQEMNQCMTQSLATVAGFHSQSGELEKGAYSFCVMTDNAAVIPVEFIKLPKPSVEP